MELFDLVEELDKDFYSLLGVTREAEYKEIRKAFKQLSLVLHPDKNDSPDADTEFRQLVSVHEILRDAEKRERYNDVLDNGLPDWRHAVYYYRRVRKMGLMEMLLILFVIITIGQYITAWAAYLERRYIVDEYLETQKKRLLKKQRKGKIDELPDMNFDIPRPSVKNTLPFQIPKLTWATIMGIPMAIKSFSDFITELRRPAPEEESDSNDEAEQEVQWTKGPRRRRNFVIPEVASNGTASSEGIFKRDEKKSSSKATPVITGGLWTDDDLSLLIKLVNKFPAGTAKRWERVAEALGRPVSEVITMTKKVKDGLTVKAETLEETAVVEKVKTKGGKLADLAEGGSKEWSSAQQKALEEALVKYPKQVSERWEKIAKAVPEMTKEDCMLRYKSLAEAVRKKKEETVNATS